MPKLSEVASTNFSNLTIDTAAIEAGAVTAAKTSANMKVRRMAATIGTIATTGAVEVILIAHCAGSVSAISFVSKDALAQHGSNYVTFTAINKGAAGAGTTALLAATDPNTTKTTTGAAIAAYTPRACTLTATVADRVVAAGDVLTFVVTATGTLANTLTESAVLITIDPS